MKKSASIHLTLVASMALVSCGQGRRCADPTGRIVPDAMCSGPTVLPGYHWISAGSSFVRRGHTTFSGHGSSGTSGGVSRGGFGAHGSAGAGGHGGGGAGA